MTIKEFNDLAVQIAEDRGFLGKDVIVFAFSQESVFRYSSDVWCRKQNKTVRSKSFPHPVTALTAFRDAIDFHQKEYDKETTLDIELNN